ncbi:MAG: hypothetical protein K2X87_01305 [Gemmataceae bacterium]|nr:hypothetical protein [Gemmataceae bacterium]
MSPNTAEPDPLLARTAELRARGLSWAAVGHELDADPDDLPDRARASSSAYRRAFNAARKEAVDEACAEALVALRRELRSDDDRARRLAADSILKLRMTEMRHGRRGKPAAPPAAPQRPPPPGGR